MIVRKAVIHALRTFFFRLYYLYDNSHVLHNDGMNDENRG